MSCACCRGNEKALKPASCACCRGKGFFSDELSGGESYCMCPVGVELQRTERESPAKAPVTVWSKLMEEDSL